MLAYPVGSPVHPREKLAAAFVLDSLDGLHAQSVYALNPATLQ
jgi:hypothetical protein